MVSMRTQDLERPASPDKTKAVLTKLNQNSDRADCQTLELVTPGLAFLILEKGFSDDICTTVLSFSELRNKGHQ